MEIFFSAMRKIARVDSLPLINAKKALSNENVHDNIDNCRRRTDSFNPATEGEKNALVMRRI
jgi:hypothetical protein